MCSISPDLFNNYREMILRDLKDLEGVKIEGYNCNKLKYADDTTLIANTKEDLQRMIDVTVTKC